MSSSSLDCEEAFEEGENFIFILPVPPDLPPPPTTESSSLDLIETLLVIFLLKLNKHENKEASDDDSEKLIPGDEFIFQSPCEDAISDLFNENLSVDIQIETLPAFHFPSEAKLPRDVINNAAPFPMVNQMNKFKDLTFEQKEQPFFKSPEKSEVNDDRQ